MTSGSFYRSTSFDDCRVGSVENYFIRENLHKARGNFFFEAGACNGFHLSQTAILEKEHKWNGVLVEPHFQMHNDLANGDRKAICQPFVLGDGSECYYEQKKEGLLGHSQIRDEQINFDCIPCVTITIEDALINAEAPRRIDYMVIDVEDAWERVLSGIDFESREIDFLAVEIKEETSNQLAPWIEKFRAHGLRFINCLGEDVIFSRS